VPGAADTALAHDVVHDVNGTAVSHQARSRRALAESEQRYRAIFDSADLSIVLLDGGACITDANPAAIGFTRRALHDLRGHGIGELLAEADREIATELKLSRRGVDYRVAKLRHKLRFDGTSTMPATRAALIARAYAIGLLQRGSWPPRVSRIEDENGPDT